MFLSLSLKINKYKKRIMAGIGTKRKTESEDTWVRGTYIRDSSKSRERLVQSDVVGP